MWYLAYASNIPAVFVMESMADTTFHDPAGIGAADRLQAKRAAMVLHHRELKPGPAAGLATAPGPDGEVGGRDRFDRSLAAPASVTLDADRRFGGREKMRQGNSTSREAGGSWP